MLKLRSAVETGPGVAPSDIAALKQMIVIISVNAVFYGLFLALVIMSTYILARQGLRDSRARQILLATTLLMITISTAHFILNILYYILQFPTLGATYEDPTALLNRLYGAQACLRRVTYLLSDVIVVWRAWIIWDRNLFVRIALGVSLLGTAVTSVILAVFNVLSYEKGKGANYSRTEVNLLGTFGLLFTNFGCTALIAIKAWQYRRSIKASLYSGDTRTRVENVFILLVESGALYCLFWTLTMMDDFGLFGEFGFEWMQPHVSGIYPTIVILLVSVQRASSDTMITLNHRASIQPLDFAARRTSLSGHSIQHSQSATVELAYVSASSTDVDSASHAWNGEGLRRTAEKKSPVPDLQYLSPANDS